MRYARIIGVSLLAIFAFVALAAASSASAAEYGQCVAAKKKGKYAEGNCLTRDEKKGKPKGHFEWVPGPSPTCVAKKKGKYAEGKCETLDEHKGKPKGHFEMAPGPGFTSSSATVSIAIAVCSASSDTGEVTGLKTLSDTVTFTGCSSLGQKCTSEGEPEGTIQTYLLEGKLVGHGEKGPAGGEPATGEAWTSFAGTPASEGYTAKFSCTGKGYFRIKGSLSGAQTGNVDVSSTTSTTTFENGVAEQELITETSETGTEWSGGIGGGPNEFGSFGEFRTKEITVSSNTAAEASEIKS